MDRTLFKKKDAAEEDPPQYEEQVINIDRVARVVKGGRRFRFRALVAIGDRNGTIGVGVDKGTDVQAAISKSVQKAKLNLLKIGITEDGTIYHEASAKVSGAKIFMKPASAGTGLIAGGVMRTIFELAGITSVLAKSLGSANKINIAYATMDALQSIKPASEWLNKSLEKK
jgi:small subunit ribosomal protein S5